MKKEDVLAKRAMQGFARHGITSVRFGKKIATMKDGEVVVKKITKADKIPAHSIKKKP